MSVSVTLTISSCGSCPYKAGTGPFDGYVCDYGQQFWLDEKNFNKVDERCPLKGK